MTQSNGSGKFGTKFGTARTLPNTTRPCQRTQGLGSGVKPPFHTLGALRYISCLRFRTKSRLLGKPEGLPERKSEVLPHPLKTTGLRKLFQHLSHRSYGS